ncbi:MAG: efflux RND transporter periplasmic adaptor subunit [Candidatus Moranbacteria bacterium]|nr:efflux RND transporter periplasmic adaptor subunit [Candidatus Moranbacteria bacterium]
MEHNNKKPSKKKKGKKFYLILLAVAVLASLLAWRFISQKEQIAQEQEEIPSIVKTIKVGKENLDSAEIEKTANLKSSRSALAVAEYAGRIKEVRAKTGDYVKAGQILAVFDQSGSANSAKLSYESAKESYEIAQDNLEKTEEVAEESLELADSSVDKAKVALKQAKKTGDEDQIEIAEENYEAAKDTEDKTEAQMEIQVNNAELQAKQSKLQLDQAEIQFNKSFIKAPVSGYVVSRSVEKNDYLNAGGSVAEISGFGYLKAKVYLNQKESARIQAGDEVGIEIGSEEKKGYVEAVSPVPSSGNQRYEAIIRTEIDAKKYANRNAIIKLEAGLVSDEGFFIPIDAVNIGQQRKIVFLERNGEAISSEVELGEVVGDKVEILSGIEGGDNLVIEGNRNLRDGELLKVEN